MYDCRCQDSLTVQSGVAPDNTPCGHKEVPGCNKRHLLSSQANYCLSHLRWCLFSRQIFDHWNNSISLATLSLLHTLIQWLLHLTDRSEVRWSWGYVQCNTTWPKLISGYRLTSCSSYASSSYKKGRNYSIFQNTPKCHEKGERLPHHKNFFFFVYSTCYIRLLM